MTPGSQDWVARLRDPADRAAAGDFAAEWLSALVEHLTRRGLTKDVMLIGEAAETAIIDFVKAPDRYDPAKRSLAGYLRMAAEGDLRNAIKREARHRERQATIPVELDQLAGNTTADSPRLEDFPELVAVRDALPSAERAVYELMRTGERSTAAFAPLIGAAHLPPAEQEAAVKRFKDRIVKRFQRAAARQPEEA